MFEQEPCENVREAMKDTKTGLRFQPGAALERGRGLASLLLGVRMSGICPKSTDDVWEVEGLCFASNVLQSLCNDLILLLCLSPCPEPAGARSSVLERSEHCGVSGHFTAQARRLANCPQR